MVGRADARNLWAGRRLVRFLAHRAAGQGRRGNVTLGVGVAHRHRKRLALIRLPRRVAVAVAADRLAVARPGILDAGPPAPPRIRPPPPGGNRLRPVSPAPPRYP